MGKGMIVSRGAGSSAAMLAFLPALFMPLMSKGVTGKDFIFFVPVMLLFVAFLSMAIYQRRTPLMKIENGSLIYYGISPWEKKSYVLAGIIKVRFSPALNFWRSARLLAIETDCGIHRLWLPNSPWMPNHLHQLHEMLKAQLKERYAEVTA